MRRSFATVVVLGTFAAVMAPVSASAASAPHYRGANTAAVQDDFNGDGYRDLAVGAPSAANGKVEGAGAAVVLYGSASGVRASSKRTVITQQTSGVPGAAEAWDGFGATTASADLDGDGYADLVVGVPDEAVGAAAGRGTVTVIWGGPSGLKGAATISVPAGYSRGRDDCGFGGSLAVGDMNGDGHPELAVGSRCEGVLYTGPFTRAGKAAAVRSEFSTGESRGAVMGDVNGDHKAELFWLPGNTYGNSRGDIYIDNAPLTGDVIISTGIHLPLGHGYEGQVGDINGDGYGDLVTGAPDDEFGPTGPNDAHIGGEIEVLYGGKNGITASQAPHIYSQDTAKVPGAGEKGDGFGYALSVGDTNGDHYADVLVGAPFEGIGRARWAGQATLLFGSASGLTGNKSVAYNQNTANVPGAAETDDSFGGAVDLRDVNKDGKADVFVGVPGEGNSGCVWIARGAATPVTKGSVNLGGGTRARPRSAAGQWGFGAAFNSPHAAQ